MLTFGFGKRTFVAGIVIEFDSELTKRRVWLKNICNQIITNVLHYKIHLKLEAFLIVIHKKLKKVIICKLFKKMFLNRLRAL